MAPMACPLCQKRKGKRFCPALNTEICSICCGREREVSIDCPFECPYLQQSRERERKELDPKDFPYKEIRVNEEDINENSSLLVEAAQSLIEAAAETPGAVDRDVRDALEALIQTYRTLESGLYYETAPEPAPARSVARGVRESLEQFEERRESDLAPLRNADVVKGLVFLLRIALDWDNGRPKGRAFLHFLRNHFQAGSAPHSGLIVPGA